MTLITNELHKLMGSRLDISEHLGILRGLACDKDVNTIVEFGFRTGVSTVALLSSGKTVISYDISPCTKHAQRMRSMAPNFKFIQSSSLKVKIPECDMLLIDSLHTYAQVSAELRLHSDRVSKWIALHDTGVHRGLRKAIKEFLDQHQNWRTLLNLTNNNGLTVLERILEK